MRKNRRSSITFICIHDCYSSCNADSALGATRETFLFPGVTLMKIQRTLDLTSPSGYISCSPGSSVASFPVDDTRFNLQTAHRCLDVYQMATLLLLRWACDDGIYGIDANTISARSFTVWFPPCGLPSPRRVLSRNFKRVTHTARNAIGKNNKYTHTRCFLQIN